LRIDDSSGDSVDKTPLHAESCEGSRGGSGVAYNLILHGSKRRTVRRFHSCTGRSATSGFRGVVFCPRAGLGPTCATVGVKVTVCCRLSTPEYKGVPNHARLFFSERSGQTENDHLAPHEERDSSTVLDIHLTNIEQYCIFFCEDKYGCSKIDNQGRGRPYRSSRPHAPCVGKALWRAFAPARGG
jgi:hypothetical protein